MTKGYTKLSFSEIMALGEIVREKYTESRLGFQEFTNLVNKDPELRKKFRNEMTASSVNRMVRELGIEPNFKPRGLQGQQSEEHCVLLTQRVARLEEQLNKLVHTVQEQQNILRKLKPLCD